MNVSAGCKQQDAGEHTGVPEHRGAQQEISHGDKAVESCFCENCPQLGGQIAESDQMSCCGRGVCKRSRIPHRRLGSGGAPPQQEPGERAGCPGVSGLEPKSWQLLCLLPALNPQWFHTSLKSGSGAAPLVSRFHKLMGPKPPNCRELPRVGQKLERRQ